MASASSPPRPANQWGHVSQPYCPFLTAQSQPQPYRASQQACSSLAAHTHTHTPDSSATPSPVTAAAPFLVLADTIPLATPCSTFSNRTSTGQTDMHEGSEQLISASMPQHAPMTVRSPGGCLLQSPAPLMAELTTHTFEGSIQQPHGRARLTAFVRDNSLALGGAVPRARPDRHERAEPIRTPLSSSHLTGRHKRHSFKGQAAGTQGLFCFHCDSSPHLLLLAIVTHRPPDWGSRLDERRHNTIRPRTSPRRPLVLS